MDFQNFPEELANIKSHYARPEGAICIAYDENKAALGCFGIRKLEDTICELKRMYIRKTARGMGLGRQLLVRAIAIGTELGYSRMRLDTLSSMEAAIRLYEKAGFYKIPPYRYNPFQGATFYELELNELP